MRQTIAWMAWLKIIGMVMVAVIFFFTVQSAKADSLNPKPPAFEKALLWEPTPARMVRVTWEGIEFLYEILQSQPVSECKGISTRNGEVHFLAHGGGTAPFKYITSMNPSAYKLAGDQDFTFMVKKTYSMDDDGAMIFETKPHVNYR